MENILEEIKYFGNEYFRIPVRNFRTGISNLIKWLPIIWKDRNWDSHYIYEIIKKKLEFQAKYISDNDRHTRAQQDARRMMICSSLIHKLQEETYPIEYMDYYKDRVWFTPCEDRPGSSMYNSEILSENFEDYFKKYPLIYKRVVNGEGVFKFDNVIDMESKHRIAMNIGHINHERAKRLLFKIMEENIEGWWD
jgi:hypothetical protein